MPLKTDADRGTESDGAKSAKYCAYCYANGQFTQPNITAEQMQVFCAEKMKEMHFPSFMAKMFTKNIPNLERWKK